MSYSRGVLIHNFNEDRFGQDLQTIPRPLDPPKISVSHTVHNWKEPDRGEQLESSATIGLEKHILFGHAGDMRDPHTNFQKTEFATASQYFFQDPAQIKDVGTLTADGFTVSDDPLTKVGGKQSLIASRIKQGWGDLRQSHAVPASDRFMTENKQSFRAAGGGLTRDQVLPRHYGEFSKGFDAVKLTRSTGSLRGGGLRTAAQLVVS